QRAEQQQPGRDHRGQHGDPGQQEGDGARHVGTLAALGWDLMDDSAPGRLLLLDTASLYFRAFFGVKDLRPAPDGTPTNATRGLLDMVATLVTRFRPTHLVACWDDDWRPAFRVEAIPTYKAHRLVEGSQ